MKGEYQDLNNNDNANIENNKNGAKAPSSNFMKFFCVGFFVLVILGIGINAIVIFVALKKPSPPEFQVKNAHVAKFDVYNPDPNDTVSVLSTDLMFSLDAANKNLIVGLQFENMLLDTSWDEVDAHLGETNVQNFVQKNKGVTTLKVNTQGEMEIPLKSVKVEDMSLDLQLSGQLHYFIGPLKTKTYAFMVFCDNLFVTNVNTHCRTEIFSDGELPPPPEHKSKRAQAPGEAPSPSDEEDVEASSPADSFPPVRLILKDDAVIVDNGLLAVTIAKPGGFVTGIKYNGMDNILDEQNPADDRGYIMMRGVSGLYSYGIFERENWPSLNLANARLAFKLQRQKFKYMVISDTRKREMPVPEDRIPPKAEQLAYPEAMKLIDPQNPDFKGEVDDKYQYSMESQDIKVHGWICKDPPTGFWQITPSYEFRSGGPNKQFLTSHVGPSTLAMFVSAHYSGDDLVPRFEEREPWKHVYGPVFMYVNNVTKDQDFGTLWDDAKKRMEAEVKNWPYRFPASQDFPKAYKRVNVTGRFFVHDKYVTDDKVPAQNAFIGLGPPGDAGSWQKDCKRYQFWTRTDDEGFFNITFVRVGTYDVFGWVNGYIGDFKHDAPSLNITVGKNVDLGDLIYNPPRDGPTLWEIGIPDRTAKEFHIPDPKPEYVNKLYVNHTDRFRQYGLWERYGELYPDDDMVYDVSKHNFKKDWFFAQVTRKIGERYNGTTWQVQFNLDNVVDNGVYKLRLALAAATNSFLEVRFNEPKPSPAMFNTGTIGDCNSVARHGIHGLYWLYNVDVQGNLLKRGDNTLYLTQTKGSGPFQGIMYDYLRFEGPSTSAM
ncbi:hypothetical protein Cgig2_004723 [Carnegiea gigantea]|uniref:rhamnogalacturonan endolyase n=1 Tax=Carnegiea gigantea TaxID=171969 RepID=A0A9Q1KST3_9CARY|nr:hypothetical protein Cgig2_004723 [Carnegiea gigantea]